jgi:asparagine synthetase B (glutamine-hydrolysing)
MGRLIEHRGPDGHGTFTDDRCGLVHRRLAIVDRAGKLYAHGTTTCMVLNKV